MKQKHQYKFDFVGSRRIAAICSGLLLIVSIVSLFVNGLNFGIDFSGGTLVELGYQETIELDNVRVALANSQFSDAIVQYFGTAKNVLIRIVSQENMNSSTISNELINLLQQAGQAVEIRRVEFVGPEVGEDLTESGGLAMLYALGGILLYVTLRFQLRFSVGAIAALVHDVIITVGVFSVLQLDFNLTVLAALLAVIGYSLNDTIVVFDRIRENFRKMKKAESREVINTSLNQTLSRTLITSLTTLLVLAALFIFGGKIIHAFSLALIIGVLIGTYSSIYVASQVILTLGVSKQDLMSIEKEGATLDSRP